MGLDAVPAPLPALRRQQVVVSWDRLQKSHRISVGLEESVREVRQDPAASDYYIHGSECLMPQCKKYATLASMSCFLAHSVLVELLEDDRVAKQEDVLRASIADEHAWLSGIPISTWADKPPHLLRSQSLHAGCIAGAFITRSVLHVLRHSP